MCNAFTKALNDNLILPRFVIIVPNADVLIYVKKQKAGITLLSGAAINWMANQMTRLALCKKEFLRALKPGSITHFEPKCMWVNMMEPPDSIVMASAARKYNRALNKMLADKDGHYVIDVNSVMKENNYFTNGQLNGTGKVQFWYYIDTQIKNFDYRRITLKPDLPNRNNSEDRDSEHGVSDLDNKSTTLSSSTTLDVKEPPHASAGDAKPAWDKNKERHKRNTRGNYRRGGFNQHFHHFCSRGRYYYY